MIRDKKLRLVFLVYSFFYLSAFCFFYYKYVPLIKSFQLFLIPILFVILTLTSVNVRWGILFFVFAFPLINNLPYFFGIQRDIPHAPTALILFLAFFLGWILNKSFFYSKSDIEHSVFRPLFFLSLIIFISGIITFVRYANFFPFRSDKIYEFVVNVNGIRAGGALMSDVFNFLNYLTGFLFFFIIFSTIKSKEFIKKLLIVLSISTLISLLFSLFQKYFSISLGNTTFWINLHQINSTFKDPNSFGVFLAGFVPVLLGMTFSFQKKLKLFSVFLIILALFVIPSIGSRSAFLGLIISAGTFFLLSLVSSKKDIKKKFIFAVSFFLIAAILILSFVLFSKQSKLYNRLNWSLSLLENKNSLDKLFNRKFNLWKVASRMIRDYPLTGVGLGAYIVELPNYAKHMRLGIRYTDSAENYFFQAGAELGLIGLILFLWLFYEIFKQIRRCWKIPGDDKDKFILIGAISGLVSIFVNTLFHSYVGAFDVKYFFWFLVAFVFIYSKVNGKPDFRTKLNRKFSFIAVILFFSFGTVHLWNSSHNLSLDNGAKKYGWNQNFGFYQQEIDDRGAYFKWTKKQAGISVENVGSMLVIPMMASHPDIEKDPISVRVYSANHSFKKDRLIKEITLRKSEWLNFEYSIPPDSEEKIYFVFEANRTWQPLKYLGVPDPRWIAISIGNVWFEYSGKIPEDKIKSIQTISQKNWEGKFQEKLWANGMARIKFNIKQKNLALRLHIRGQKAFDLGPHIVVRIDGRTIGRTLLTEDNWTSLVFTPEISESEHVLSVEFINDFNNRDLGQDRSVFLGDLEIIYLK